MNALLYGHNPEENIVAVHQAGDNLMRVYIRRENGITSEDVEFFPFFLLSDSSYLSALSVKYWVKELSGKNFYRYLCAFPGWSEMWEAIRHILELYNKSASKKAETFLNLPILYLRPNPASQFLIQSGRTLFKGMEFQDLHRLQLDIETYAKQPSHLSDPSRVEDRIIVIALSDNRGWKTIIDGKKHTEKEMLTQLVDIIQEKDPDVIEGHNIYDFDLPCILRRCELAEVEFKVGRDGSTPKSTDTWLGFSDPEQAPYDITGRHIIDTLLLLKSYDAAKGILESYSLKYAAKYFGVARSNRVYIRGDQVSWYWDNEPDVLLRYASDDIHEVAQLSEILSPSVFNLVQMVPLSYGTLSRVGSAAKIECLLLREYVHQKHSIPKPQTGSQHIGGYTDIFHTGVLGPILYADIESLYPSIMIRENISPATDTLKVFPSLLKQLTEMRLDSKKRMSATTDHREKAQLDASQSAYKILINSFYGYLGYPHGIFNDYNQADNITTQGQKILRTIIEEIRHHNGKVIEVDTDGIFFVPPNDVQSQTAEEKFLRRIAVKLPNNIKLVIDSRYKKMLSYKKKNYAVLGYDGKITIKGSSLVSRSMERFGKLYIQQCIECLLEGAIERLHRIYVSLYHDIVNHKIDIHDLARTETLRDSPERYERDVTARKRNRTASYEVAISSGLQWKPGTKVSYYITGNDAEVVGFKNCKLVEQWDPNFPDENVPYYLRRLDELSKKFELFFLPHHFRSIFSVDDLFDFSPHGIGIITSQVHEEPSAHYEEDEEHGPIDISIWLDSEKNGKTL